MTGSDPVHSPANRGTDKVSRPEAKNTEQASRTGLTRGEARLAAATAAAILASGLNALVQIARMAIECWRGHG